MTYESGRGGSVLIRVPNSLATTVSITAASGRAITVYTDVARSASVAMPDAVTADKLYYLDRDDNYVVSLKVNGVEAGVSGTTGTPATKNIGEGRQATFTIDRELAELAVTTNASASYSAIQGGLHQSTQSTAGLGPELLTNGSLASNATGWTLTNAAWSGGAVVVSANGSLSQSVSVVSGQQYVVSWTHTPWPQNGTWTIALGAASIVIQQGGARSAVITAATTGTVTFSFTGDGTTSGASVSGFTLKAVTGGSLPAFSITDENGTVRSEFRADANGNTASGYQALATSGVSLGSNNTAYGYQALKNDVSGDNNTAVGRQALTSLLSGEFCTAVGSGALQSLTTGYDCTAVGQGALGSVLTAWGNTAVGTLSLNANLANFCTAVGNNALTSNTTGVSNTAVGDGALSKNTTSTGLVAVGAHALYNSTGANNTAVGYTALTACTTGAANTTVGYQAGAAVTTGSNNVAVGRNALFVLSTNGSNTAVGDSALQNATTASNVGIGASALVSQTSPATPNVAVGTGAFNSLTTGASNTAVGHQAGYKPANTVANASLVGVQNTFVGYQCGASSASDPSNATALGYFAVVAAHGTALGAGASAAGAGSVAIGRDHNGTAASAATQDYFVLGTTAHKLFIPGLPTADPHVVGQLWASAGVVTVSAG